jgi:hypothetical protein
MHHSKQRNKKVNKMHRILYTIKLVFAETSESRRALDPLVQHKKFLFLAPLMRVGEPRGKSAGCKRHRLIMQSQAVAGAESLFELVSACSWRSWLFILILPSWDPSLQSRESTVLLQDLIRKTNERVPC